MQELSKLDLTGLACRASSHIGMTWRASPCTCSRCHEAEPSGPARDGVSAPVTGAPHPLCKLSPSPTVMGEQSRAVIRTAVIDQRPAVSPASPWQGETRARWLSGNMVGPRSTDQRPSWNMLGQPMAEWARVAAWEKRKTCTRLRCHSIPSHTIALLVESEDGVIDGAAGSLVRAAVCAECRARLVAAKPASLLAELLL
jgi:hypothetical protein